MKQQNSLTLFSLLMVVAIDGMGLGFIFPVITPLFMHPSAHSILPAAMSTHWRDVTYGSVVALYPLFMFFGAPVLGEISDKLGRKKVLMICLFGTAIGYIISGIGITTSSLLLLIIGRIIDGLTAGSLPLAQAAIADLSDNEMQQAKNMGLMMFAIAGGQVIDPFIGGILSDHTLWSGFNAAVAMYFGCGLAIFNIIWLALAFTETYVVAQTANINLLKSFRSFAEVFHSRVLIHMTIVLFAMQLSWSLYFQAISAFLNTQLHYSNFMIGLFSAVLGIVLGISGSVILPRLLKIISIQTAAVIGLLLMACGNLLAGILSQHAWQWLWMIIIVAGAAITFPALITLFSSLVNKTRQGWINGLTGAVIASSWTITALLAGLLIAIGILLPMFVAAVFALLGAVYLLRFKINPLQAADD